MLRKIGPFVLVFTLAVPAAFAQNPPPNGGTGCGGTHGGSTGCKGPKPVKVPTLLDLNSIITSILVALP